MPDVEQQDFATSVPSCSKIRLRFLRDHGESWFLRSSCVGELATKLVAEVPRFGPPPNKDKPAPYFPGVSGPHWGGGYESLETSSFRVFRGFCNRI